VASTSIGASLCERSDDTIGVTDSGLDLSLGPESGVRLAPERARPFLRAECGAESQQRGARNGTSEALSLLFLQKKMSGRLTGPGSLPAPISGVKEHRSHKRELQDVHVDLYS